MGMRLCPLLPGLSISPNDALIRRSSPGPVSREPGPAGTKILTRVLRGAAGRDAAPGRLPAIQAGKGRVGGWRGSGGVEHLTHLAPQSVRQEWLLEQRRALVEWSGWPDDRFGIC